jgi:hypothetical protein
MSAAGISANSLEHLKKMIKETDTMYIPSSRGRGIGNPQFDHSRLPRPRIVTQYAHATGCVHSGKPDVKLLSKPSVEYFDALARKRLANIRTLLETEVDYEVGPNPYAACMALAKAHVDFDSSEDDSRLSTRSASATGSDVASVFSNTLPQSSRGGLTDEEAARFIYFATKAETCAQLRAEEKRLADSIATSSLAKGMYVKKCNGEYVNGLGDVLPTEAVGFTMAKGNGLVNIQPPRTSASQAKQESGSGRDFNFASSDVTPATPTTMTASPSNSPVSAGSSCTTSLVAAQSSTLTSDTAANARTTPTLSTIATESSRNSRCGYALLKNGTDVTLTPTRDSTAATVPDSFYSINKPKPVCPPFAYTTAMVLAREEMIRNGTVPPEDLAFTGWCFHRTIKQQEQERKLQLVESFAKEHGNVDDYWTSRK